jgi:hypothetical protein
VLGQSDNEKFLKINRRNKTMKRIVGSILTGALLVGAATAAFADEKIHDRKQNQQQRIAQGVKGGSLTSGGTERRTRNPR